MGVHANLASLEPANLIASLTYRKRLIELSFPALGKVLPPVACPS